MTVFGFDHPPSFFEKADPEGEHNLTVLMPHTKHDNNRTGTSRDDLCPFPKYVYPLSTPHRGQSPRPAKINIYTCC